MKFLKPDLTASQALNSDPLSYTSPAITKPFKLDEVTLHADLAITETITITRLSGSYLLDAGAGTSTGATKSSNYDVVMIKTTLTAATDYVFAPRSERDFQPGEQVKVELTNTNKAGQIVYISIKRSSL